MANVEKELLELLAQYRSDSNKNINPFSMRLQGVIDANVMGGISKYQQAFFTEDFANSVHGRDQQVNVHKLHCLIHDQILILETALELHGELAPAEVQPLHKRLLERFSQLKKSLLGMDKLKRPHSESIVNTPLPPLPTEKRTTSLEHPAGGIYEQDDIYTRPMDLNNLRRESCNSVIAAPPIPSRPRLSCYGKEGPEIPPKLTKDKINAPPLPPRGLTADKRASNSSFDQIPCLPRKGPKHSINNSISMDDLETDNLKYIINDIDICIPPNDFCDPSAEMVINSNDLNNPNNYNASFEYKEIYQHRNQFQNKPDDNDNLLNITQTTQSFHYFDGELVASSTPPPIPPKSSGIIFSDESISPIPLNNGSNYCVPKNEETSHD